MRLGGLLNDLCGFILRPVSGVKSKLFSLLAMTMLHSSRYNLKFCQVQLERRGKIKIIPFSHLALDMIHLVRT